MIASGFSWFNILPPLDQDVIGHALGGATFNVSTVMASAWLSTFLVLCFAFLGRMQITKALARPEHERYTADNKFSFFALVDMFGSFIRGMMADVMPKHEVRHYSAYIASLFLYIVFCNLQGLVPGFVPPTDNINANMGMAIASFLVFMWVGLSRDAAGFIKHLMGPSLFIAPLLFPLESLSLILRPITLSVRLAGNMFGDHQVFSIMSNLIPIGLPAVLMVLATLVSFIQAFVFSLLSSVYIGLSLPHDHHDHDDGHGEAAH